MVSQVNFSILMITLACFSSHLFADSTTPITLSKSPTWLHSTMPNSPSLRGTAIIHNSLWVTGSNNSVFVSQDAGNNWQDKSVPLNIKTDFRDIELFNNDTAIVMGSGIGELSTLYKTNDGGNNWQLLYQNSDELGFFNSIAFWSEQQGLLMGDPVDGYYVIKKTTDGGKTWRRITLKNLPPILPKETAFAASGNSVVVGKNGKAWITTGGFSASIYISNDYGETWQRDSVPLHKTSQTSGGYAVALNHQDRPFVIGGDYLQRSMKYSNMARLINEQWQSVNTVSAGLRTAMSCQYNICLTTGKIATDVSFDAGNTWQALTHQQSNESTKGTLGFYSLASHNKLFLAAGAKGKVAIISYKGLSQLRIIDN